MDIAVAPDIPTYSGGLGILAGDRAQSAADRSIPLTVALVSRATIPQPARQCPAQDLRVTEIVIQLV